MKLLMLNKVKENILCVLASVSQSSFNVSSDFGLVMPLIFHVNIAIGTTDPEIDFVTWTKFGNHMAPLALVENLTTRWRHLHIWPPRGTTGIG